MLLCPTTYTFLHCYKMSRFCCLRYCKKFKVYDMRDKKEFTFLVDQWMSIWPGEHIEAVTTAAKPRDEYTWTNVIAHNIIYNFQDKHLWLSIFVRLVVLVYY